MLDLAQNFGEKPIPLKRVAERQNVSEHYLEQLIAMLKKAALVKSVRGAQGGYLLAREPSQVTVGDVFRAMEGPVAPLYCVSEEDPGDCDESDYCITRSVWARVRDGIVAVIDSITLEDLCREAEEALNRRGRA
jgi:Rrf2 family protein